LRFRSHQGEILKIISASYHLLWDIFLTLSSLLPQSYAALKRKDEDLTSSPLGLDSKFLHQKAGNTRNRVSKTLTDVQLIKPQ
jgi:hypothetical protein